MPNEVFDQRVSPIDQVGLHMQYSIWLCRNDNTNAPRGLHNPRTSYVSKLIID
jgi:hypothetical protein